MAVDAVSDSSAAIEEKKTISTELKDWNESHREPAEVTRYVGVELPILIKALKDGEPSSKRDSPEQVRVMTLF